MSYPQFLLQWYNVVFLFLGLAGVVAWIGGRRGLRRRPLVTGALIGTAVAGLTVNGAVHDLALGDPAAVFPAVLGGSLVAGFLLGWGYRALSRRYFPPVHAVRIDSPDLSGLEARVISKSVGRSARSGRAQRQEEGTLYIVHCHAHVEGIRFGRAVRLAEYDEALGSYRVEKVR